MTRILMAVLLGWGILLGPLHLTATPAKANSYGAAVTLTPGLENQVLLGGRDEFFQAVRWCFKYKPETFTNSLGNSSTVPRAALRIQFQLKDEYGGSWTNTVRWGNFQLPNPSTDDSSGCAENAICFSQSGVTGVLTPGQHVDLNVNIPHRVKFNPAAGTGQVADNACDGMQ